MVVTTNNVMFTLFVCSSATHSKFMEVDAQDVHDLCPEAKALSILKMSRKPENKDDMFHVRFDALTLCLVVSFI